MILAPGVLPIHRKKMISQSTCKNYIKEAVVVAQLVEQLVDSVTRLGDFLDFGPLFKAFGSN